MKMYFLSTAAALALLGPALAWGQAPPPPPPPYIIGASPQGNAPQPFTVQGKLGRPTTGMAYLFYDTPTGKPDSARISNGRFTLRGTAQVGTLAGLYAVEPGQVQGLRKSKRGQRVPQPLPIYLEPGTIKVSSPDSLPHATALGTPLNADNNRLTALLLPTAAQRGELMARYRAATPAQQQDKAFSEALDKQGEAIEAAQQVVLAAFIRTTPQSIVSLNALERYTGYGSAIDPATAEPLFMTLAPTIRSSKSGQKFVANLVAAKLTAVGALAPDFT